MYRYTHDLSFPLTPSTMPESLHLLVAHEDESLHEALSRVLSDDTCRISGAASGADALERIYQNSPDVVLLGTKLPDMDACDVLRRVRREGGRMQPTVLAVGGEADVAGALCGDADGYLVWPASDAQLRAYKHTLTRLRSNWKQMEQSETRMRLWKAALESAANSIAITDRDGRILWVNPAFATSYGYDKDELLGRRPGDVIKSGVHDDAFYRNMWDTILSGQVWSGEVVNKRRDGSLLTEELTITPVRDEQGEVANFIAIKQDITERKRLEKQFLRSQRMESIGTLAGGIAHDLNNLLAPIVMGVDLLAERETDRSVQSVIQNMRQSAARGTSLVKQVLSFARGVEGARVTVRLDRVVEEVVSMARTSFPKTVRVQTGTAEGLWPILGDPTQLNQVILNLAVNARDAMPGGGLVRIEISNVTIDEQYASMQTHVESGDYVRLEIADEGCGMSQEVQDRIFEPFYSTKEAGQGTGLGLSTVLGIVRSHGGFINVYSETGKGTTVKVYFPAQHGVDVADPEPEPGVDSPRGHGETILVVDDELSILTITKHTLESYGYRVLTADDGAQAIGVFAMNRTDVALTLTDMMMPVMDGPALVKAIRRIDAGARIVAVSGLQGGVNVARAAQVGVTDFLEKPFTAQQLLITIRKALDGERGRA